MAKQWIITFVNPLDCYICRLKSHFMKYRISTCRSFFIEDKYAKIWSRKGGFIINDWNTELSSQMGMGCQLSHSIKRLDLLLRSKTKYYRNWESYTRPMRTNEKALSVTRRMSGADPEIYYWDVLTQNHLNKIMKGLSVAMVDTPRSTRVECSTLHYNLIQKIT